MSFDITDSLLKQWNEVLAHVADIAQVPVALIMRQEGEKIKVFAKNDNPQNPYSINESEILNGSGLYCEQVIKTNAPLIVENAYKDSQWNNNPDLKLGLLSYMGLPIKDQNDDIFGTICVLDTKEHLYDQRIVDFINSIKALLEQQIKDFSSNKKKKNTESLLDIINLTCGIAHEINTPIGVAITANSLITDKGLDLKEALGRGTLSLSKLEGFINGILASAELINTNLRKSSELIKSFKEMGLNDEKIHDVNSAVVLIDLISNVIDNRKAHWQTKQCDLNVTFNLKSKPDSLEIYSQTYLIKKVISNLIDNSYTHGFTEGDEFTISISSQCKNRMVLINYKDNGVGVNPSEKEIIFSPFHTTNRVKGSLGLGLSIAKKVVVTELHGEISCLDCDDGIHIQILLPLKHNPE